MVKVRYIGDGSRWVPGRPAIEGQVEDVSADEATGLISTGLYVRVGSSKKPDPEQPEPDKADGAAGGESA